MLRMHRSSWLVALCGFCVLSGCTNDPALDAQRDRLAGEQVERMAELDRIEGRLLMAHARQREWSELQQRHERVSAIACENVSEHVAAMIRHEERQQERGRRKRAAAVHEVRAETRPTPAHALTAIDRQGGLDGG